MGKTVTTSSSAKSSGKKAKSSASATSTSTTLPDIPSITERLLSTDGHRHLNDLLQLIAIVEDHGKYAESTVVAAIHAQSRAFAVHLPHYAQTVRSDLTEDPATAAVGRWLRAQHERACVAYCKVLASPVAFKRARVATLSALLDTVRTESTAGFATDRFAGILRACLEQEELGGSKEPTIDDDNTALSLDMLRVFYLDRYADLRYHCYRVVPKVVAELLEGKIDGAVASNAGVKRKQIASVDAGVPSYIAERLFTLLLKMKAGNHEDANEEHQSGDDSSDHDSEGESSSGTDDDGETGITAKDTIATATSSFFLPALPIKDMASRERKALSEAWLAFLRLPLSSSMYKRVLGVLHTRVMPRMQDPRRLHDFLTDSYNQGGTVSLLALNGLFTLIHEHNLDYPDFYGKLYALFDRDMLHLKHRARFLTMADLFLKSSHLPAYLVAAFLKRMARLALFASPAAVLAVVPMIHNLLLRHPSCLTLLHRELDEAVPAVSESPVSATETTDDRILLDPYDFDEVDPVRSRAAESSLWELEALKEHYYGSIATLVRGLKKPLDVKKVVPYNMEDFLHNSYASIIEEELKRPMKQTPAINHEKVTTLLASGSLLARMVHEPKDSEDAI